LPLFAEETPYPATAALNEPRIIFDPFDLKTTASREGDAVVLNGVKSYVPNAENAAWILVYARDTESGKTGAYLVEAGAEGVTIAERDKLMGVRGLPTSSVSFNNVRVANELVLGGDKGIDFQRLLNHMN